MADRKTIESVSASTVFYRVVGGAALIVVALMYQPIASNRNLMWLFIVGGGALVISGWKAVANPQLAIRYHFNSRKTVADLIREWAPQSARLESEYEKSLHQFLKSKLPFVKVTRQYGSARVKCDLATGNDVMIELKNGLRTTNKLQRLLGQLELYRNEWKKPVIIVLLGESQEDLLHDLNRTVQKYEGVEVLTKSVAAPTEIENGQAAAKG